LAHSFRRRQLRRRRRCPPYLEPQAKARLLAAVDFDCGRSVRRADEAEDLGAGEAELLAASRSPMASMMLACSSFDHILRNRSLWMGK
jgi:hypothetical protein